MSRFVRVYLVRTRLACVSLVRGVEEEAKNKQERRSAKPLVLSLHRHSIILVLFRLLEYRLYIIWYDTYLPPLRVLSLSGRDARPGFWGHSMDAFIALSVASLSPWPLLCCLHCPAPLFFFLLTSCVGYAMGCLSLSLALFSCSPPSYIAAKHMDTDSIL